MVKKQLGYCSLILAEQRLIKINLKIINFQLPAEPESVAIELAACYIWAGQSEKFSQESY